MRAMKLSKYIELIGDPAAAVLFGVPERRVNSWRLEQRWPRTKDARKIISATKGKVSWEEIYPEQIETTQ